MPILWVDLFSNQSIMVHPVLGIKNLAGMMACKPVFQAQKIHRMLVLHECVLSGLGVQLRILEPSHCCRGHWQKVCHGIHRWCHNVSICRPQSRVVIANHKPEEKSLAGTHTHTHFTHQVGLVWFVFCAEIKQLTKPSPFRSAHNSF